MPRSGFPSHAVRPLTSLVALWALGALAACSHGSTNLAGHWRGLRAEGVPPEALDAANSYANHMRIDVNGNAITVTTAKDTRTDKYVVVSEDKTKTIITTELDGATDPQTFTFTDATTMKWAVASGGSPAGASGGATVVFTKE